MVFTSRAFLRGGIIKTIGFNRIASRIGENTLKKYSIGSYFRSCRSKHRQRRFFGSELAHFSHSGSLCIGRKSLIIIRSSRAQVCCFQCIISSSYPLGSMYDFSLSRLRELFWTRGIIKTPRGNPRSIIIIDSPLEYNRVFFNRFFRIGYDSSRKLFFEIISFFATGKKHKRQKNTNIFFHPLFHLRL